MALIKSFSSQMHEQPPVGPSSINTLLQEQIVHFVLARVVTGVHRLTAQHSSRCVMIDVQPWIVFADGDPSGQRLEMLLFPQARCV